MTRIVGIAFIACLGLATVACSSDSKTAAGSSADPQSSFSSHAPRGTLKVGGIFGRTVTKNPDIGAYEAVDAFFKDANAHGGINGYTIQFEGIDDQGDPAQFSSAVQKLVDDHVDVIISSAQTEVKGGIDQIKASGIPYIGGNAHSRAILETPNLFPTGANLQNGIARVIATLMSTANPPVKDASVTGVNNPAVKPAVDAVTADLSAAGITPKQTGTFELTETDFTGIASQIIGTGAKDAVVYALTSQQPAIVQALDQQSYDGNVYGGSYDATLPQKLGSAGDGHFFTVLPWAALDAGDAGAKAESIVKQSYRDVDLMGSRQAMDAWTSAEIFASAIQQLGDKPVSSASIIDTLNSFNGFKTTFMAPITYKSGADGHLDVSNCMQALVIKSGAWTVAGNDRFTCWQGSVAPTS